MGAQVAILRDFWKPEDMDIGVWEFAPSTRKELNYVSLEDVQCEFF